MYLDKLKTLVKRALKSHTSSTGGFHPSSGLIKIPSKHALRTAKQLRGIERKPAIIIHGVLPRSGTVYVGQLLRLHPDLHAYPNEMWEIPVLQLTGDILDLQKRFFQAYKPNVDRIGQCDFLPLFGSAFISYLHSFAPKGLRLLLKIPSVQYLSHFFAMFPFENLLLLIRDGRDVVSSTIRTWPSMRFTDVCKKWEISTRTILAFHAQFSDQNEGYWFVKFENAVSDPAYFVKEACNRFGLNEARFPYDKIQDIKVRGSSALNREGNVSWDAIEKPKDFSPINRWKEWSPKKKTLFKKIAGQTLMAAGYCEDLDW